MTDDVATRTGAGERTSGPLGSAPGTGADDLPHRTFERRFGRTATPRQIPVASGVGPELSVVAAAVWLLGDLVSLPVTLATAAVLYVPAAIATGAMSSEDRQTVRGLRGARRQRVGQPKRGSA